jgi:hypothetical protein
VLAAVTVVSTAAPGLAFPWTVGRAQVESNLLDVHHSGDVCHLWEVFPLQAAYYSQVCRRWLDGCPLVDESPPDVPPVWCDRR